MANGMEIKKPSLFTRFAKWTACETGKPITFITAVVVVVVWAVTGPMFHYSDTWQLVINTGTTIVTFLMVFLIQNTQNRDSQAVQVKLDEIIRALKGASNEVLDLEELDEKDLQEVHDKYLKLAKEARNELDEEKEDAKNDIRKEKEDAKNDIREEKEEVKRDKEAIRREKTEAV